MSKYQEFIDGTLNEAKAPAGPIAAELTKVTDLLDDMYDLRQQVDGSTNALIAAAKKHGAQAADLKKAEGTFGVALVHAINDFTKALWKVRDEVKAASAKE